MLHMEISKSGSLMHRSNKIDFLCMATAVHILVGPSWIIQMIYLLGDLSLFSFFSLYFVCFFLFGSFLRAFLA